MVPVGLTLQRAGPGLDRRRGAWGPAWLVVAACAVAVAVIAGRRVNQPH